MIQARIDGKCCQVFEKLAVVERNLEFEAVLIDRLEMLYQVPARPVEVEEDVERTYGIGIIDFLQFVQQAFLQMSPQGRSDIVIQDSR